MIHKIIVNELRLLASDRIPWAAALIFGAAVGFGIHNGVSYEKAARASEVDRAEKQAEAERSRAEGVSAFLGAHPVATEQEWYALWSGGKLAPDLKAKSMGLLAQTVGATPVRPTLPIPALAALSIGRRDIDPTSAEVSIWNTSHDMWDEPRLENPADLLAGRFDLAFVLVYLYPLLILALGYDMLSAEKERGTLTLLLSQPIPLRSVVLGKLATRGGIAIAMALGLAGAGILIGGIAPEDVVGFRRLALGGTLVIAYGAFWLALVVAVSALGRPSATNATLLAAAWLAIAIAIPAAINLVADAAYRGYRPDSCENIL